MDISHITKVITRNRVDEEVDRLEKKVKKEAQNQIKLRVAQDASYWELNEKYVQLQDSYKKLHDKNGQIQLKYEEVSGKLEDEMRLQPEILNKITSTRKISDVLDASCNHLKTTLDECQVNLSLLEKNHESSLNTVNDLNMKLTQMKEGHCKEIKHLEEKEKTLEMHMDGMLQFFNSSKQDSDVLIRDMKDELKATSQKKEELQTIVSELSTNKEQQNWILQEKNKEIQNLKNYQEQQIEEFNKQYNDIKLQMENDVKQSNDVKESLQKALDSQKEFNKTVCLERSQLRDQLSILEKEKNMFKAEVDEMKIKLHSIVTEMDNLKLNIQSMEKDKQIIGEELVEDRQELINKNNIIAEINLDNTNMKQELLIAEETMREYKTNNETIITELKKTLEFNEKELRIKGDNINKIMIELKKSKEAESFFENIIDKKSLELNAEKERASKQYTQHATEIDKYQALIKEQVENIEKQRDLIFIMKSEKEKLQTVIESLEKKLNIVQNQVLMREARPTGVTTPSHVTQPDDNANMFSPPLFQPVQRMEQPESTECAAESRKRCLNIYNIFTDSSDDLNNLSLTDKPLTQVSTKPTGIIRNTKNNEKPKMVFQRKRIQLRSKRVKKGNEDKI